MEPVVWTTLGTGLAKGVKNGLGCKPLPMWSLVGQQKETKKLPLSRNKKLSKQSNNLGLFLFSNTRRLYVTSVREFVLGIFSILLLLLLLGVLDVAEPPLFHRRAQDVGHIVARGLGPIPSWTSHLFRCKKILSFFKFSVRFEIVTFFSCIPATMARWRSLRGEDPVGTPPLPPPPTPPVPQRLWN